MADIAGTLLAGTEPPPEDTSSAAWIFFGFRQGTDGTIADQSVATCRLCNKDVSAKGSNNSNLFSHLKSKHPRQFAELKQSNKPLRGSRQR